EPFRFSDDTGVGYTVPVDSLPGVAVPLNSPPILAYTMNTGAGVPLTKTNPINAIVLGAIPFHPLAVLGRSANARVGLGIATHPVPRFAEAHDTTTIVGDPHDRMVIARDVVTESW